MFKALGLLGRAPCPEETLELCHRHRVNCPFSHAHLHASTSAKGIDKGKTREIEDDAASDERNGDDDEGEDRDSARSPDADDAEGGLSGSIRRTLLDDDNDDSDDDSVSKTAKRGNSADPKRHRFDPLAPGDGQRGGQASHRTPLQRNSGGIQVSMPLVGEARRKADEERKRREEQEEKERLRIRAAKLKELKTGRPSTLQPRDASKGSAHHAAPDPAGKTQPAPTSYNGQMIGLSDHLISYPINLGTRNEVAKRIYDALWQLYSAALPEKGEADGDDKADDASPSASARKALESVLRRLAREDALSQELTTLKKTTKSNRAAYKMAAVTEIAAVSKRRKDKQAVATLRKVGREACKLLESCGITSPRSKEEGEEEGPEAVTERVTTMLRECEEVGLSADRTRKMREKETRQEGKLSAARLEAIHFVAPPQRLPEFGYPWPAKSGPSSGGDRPDDAKTLEERIKEVWAEGGTHPTAEGTSQRCIRCGTDYQVRNLTADVQQAEKDLEAALSKQASLGPEGAEDEKARQDEKVKIQRDALEKAKSRFEECAYHWGKRRFERESASVRSSKVARFTCCGKLDLSANTNLSSGSVAAAAYQAGMTVLTGDSSESFCARGPHVFKEDDDLWLHRRVGFRTAEGLRAEIIATDTTGRSDGMAWRETREIVALDAELVQTTAGLSLARLSLVDEDGKTTLLDRLVKPHAAVVDLATRFSGIQPGELDQPGLWDLDQVRRRAIDFIGPKTILVGHGVENDLRAMRLLHDRIVDTALLFPHPRGLPLRLPLKELVNKHLGRIVQNAAHLGHSSAEDAADALELVRWKARHDPLSIFRPKTTTAAAPASVGGAASDSRAAADVAGSASEGVSGGPAPPPPRTTPAPNPRGSTPSVTAAKSVDLPPSLAALGNVSSTRGAAASGPAPPPPPPPPPPGRAGAGAAPAAPPAKRSRPQTHAASFLFVPKKARR